MNVKRYRAATMRAALEKIKSELGEDALVLGSNSVRSAGFFGFGAKNMIEVRVSTDSNTGISADVPSVSKSTPQKSMFTSLSLNDSAPVKQVPSPALAPTSTPASFPVRPETSGSAFSALAAR